MGSKYASGKNSIAECDRCGFRYMLKDLRKLVIKTKQVSIKVCDSCWEPDQPQLSLCTQ
jgi:DNA-directed RNA polymerase subunit RPC12/RpoP